MNKRRKVGMKKIGMCFLSLVLLCGCQQHSTKQKQVKQKDTIVLGYGIYESEAKGEIRLYE